MRLLAALQATEGQRHMKDSLSQEEEMGQLGDTERRGVRWAGKERQEWTTSRGSAISQSFPLIPGRQAVPGLLREFFWGLAFTYSTPMLQTRGCYHIVPHEVRDSRVHRLCSLSHLQAPSQKVKYKQEGRKPRLTHQPLSPGPCSRHDHFWTF